MMSVAVSLIILRRSSMHCAGSILIAFSPKVSDIICEISGGGPFIVWPNLKLLSSSFSSTLSIFTVTIFVLYQPYIASRQIHKDIVSWLATSDYPICPLVTPQRFLLLAGKWHGSLDLRRTTHLQETSHNRCCQNRGHLVCGVLLGQHTAPQLASCTDCVKKVLNGI